MSMAVGPIDARSIAERAIERWRGSRPRRGATGRRSAFAQPTPVGLDRLAAWLDTLPAKGLLLAPPSRSARARRQAAGDCRGMSAMTCAETRRAAGRLSPLRRHHAAESPKAWSSWASAAMPRATRGRCRRAGSTAASRPWSRPAGRCWRRSARIAPSCCPRAGSGAPTTCRRHLATAPLARPLSWPGAEAGWRSASPAATRDIDHRRHAPGVQRLALGGAGRPAAADRAVQARRLCQRRRRVPSPMGLTMIVDGIGAVRRNSSRGSSARVGGASTPAGCGLDPGRWRLAVPAAAAGRWASRRGRARCRVTGGSGWATGWGSRLRQSLRLAAPAAARLRLRLATPVPSARAPLFAPPLTRRLANRGSAGRTSPGSRTRPPGADASTSIGLHRRAIRRSRDLGRGPAAPFQHRRQAHHVGRRRRARLRIQRDGVGREARADRREHRVGDGERAEQERPGPAMLARGIRPRSRGPGGCRRRPGSAACRAGRSAR